MSIESVMPSNHLILSPAFPDLSEQFSSSKFFIDSLELFCVDNYVFYKEEQFYFFLFSVYDILSSSCFIGSAMTPSILLNRNYQGRNRIVTHLK